MDIPYLVIVPLHYTYIIYTFKLYIIEEIKEEKVIENLINGFIKIPLVHSSLWTIYFIIKYKCDCIKSLPSLYAYFVGEIDTALIICNGNHYLNKSLQLT